MNFPVVVFSHLRWNFVFQRPQQLLSRLAAHHPVFFIEEPMPLHDDSSAPQWEITRPQDNVTVCRPRVGREGDVPFCDSHLQQLKPMLDELFSSHDIQSPALWFYSPMAAPLAEQLTSRVVIYDCMDELSAFLNPPPQLLEREDHLLKRADVVFTGGPSLYRHKQKRHDAVYCFPSSVDAAHFGKALEDGPEPDDQRSIPHPRLGFFGVIDERSDLALLDSIATRHPTWHLIMIGPVVKIDPAVLPRHSNIHWLGGREYNQLPHYLRGWDLCLLPFARNKSTEFISPTKTLEYMAAEKPIVSTPITDVAEPYGEIVYLGSTPDEFIAACERALTQSVEEKHRRINAMRSVLAKTSWDKTAEEMRKIMLECASRASSKRPNAQADGGTSAAHRAEVSEAQSNSQQNSEPREAPVVIIGAGPTGLSAAYHLGSSSLLLEQQNQIGGWGRSFVDNGFTFDLAGHIMFSKEEYVHQLYKMLLGDNVHWQDREAFIYSKGVYTRYPFQGCLYGLPVDVITECIIGAIEARFGSIKDEPELHDAVSSAAHKLNGNGTTNGNGTANANGNGNALAAARTISNGHTATHGNGNGNGNGSAKSSGISKSAAHGTGNGTGNGASSHHATRTPRLNTNQTTPHSPPQSDPCTDPKDCCADGIMEAEVRLANGSAHSANGKASNKPQNFEEFIYKVWGKGIARHFAIPYNQKLWAVPLHEMETSWLGGRVPMPDIEEMIRYALTPAAKPMGPNARFGYPLKGGFQALMNGFLPHVQDRLILNARVERISPEEKTVTLQDGRVISYEQLVSTMPLPLLIKAMGDAVPQRVRNAASKLRHVSVRCVNIGVGRPNLTEKHWVYYPEDTVFHRIFFQGNASPHCNPPGGFGITCEITYSPSKPLPCDGEALTQRCIDDCIRVGLFTKDDPIWAANQVDMPYAYVVYDHARLQNVSIIRTWLAQHEIFLAGRYSEWEYFNSDHAFMSGKRIADEVLQHRQSLMRDDLDSSSPPRTILGAQSLSAT